MKAWKDYTSAHIITCLPLINSPNTPYCRDEPSYLLYKKQTPYSFTVTQTNNKAKAIEKATPSSLYPAIYQAGFCVSSLFLEGCKTFTRNSLITVILLSTKENKTPTTPYTVRNFIIKGENDEGWAEIHAGIHGSSRLPFFPGRQTLGPAGPSLVQSPEKCCNFLWAPPCRTLHCKLNKGNGDSHIHPGLPRITRVGEWNRGTNYHGCGPGSTCPCSVPKWPCHVSSGVGPRPWPRWQKLAPLPPICSWGPRISNHLCGQENFVRRSCSQVISYIFSSPLKHI